MTIFSSWFLCALVSAFAVGLFAFSNKFNVAQGHSPTLTAFLYYWFSVPLAFLVAILFGALEFSWPSVLLGLLTGVLYPLNIIYRQKALKHMLASLYFTLMRLVSGMVLLLAGIFLFENQIAPQEWVGFFMGLIAFVLLFEPGESDNKEKHLGIKFLFITIILIVFAHIGNNLATNRVDFNVYDFYLVSILMSTCTSCLLGGKNIFTNVRAVVKNEQLVVAAVQALLGTLALILTLVALQQGGDLGIVYKVISYSILVPVLLSSIFYGERFSKRTGLAFVLVLASLWLFI